MKRAIMRTVSLILTVSIMNIFAFGVYSYSEDFTVSALSETTCTITGYSGSGGSITIPSEIDGLSVTAISPGAFRNRTDITEAAFGEGIVKIGSYAFQNCTSLLSISLPDSLNEIGQCAFTGCSSLKGVKIPDSTEIIGTQAFGNCVSLSSLGLPENWTYVSTVKVSEGYDNTLSPFIGCTLLKEIVYPAGASLIPVNAFRGCTQLEKVTIPDSILLIGERSFDDCSSVTEISLPAEWKICSQKFDADGKIYIDGINSGLSPFTGCTSLKEIEINAQAKSVPANAFNGCSYLEKVTIHEGVESIELSAFENCTYLFTADIGGNVTSISETAFSGCEYLDVYGISGSATEEFFINHKINFVDKSIFNTLITVSGVSSPDALIFAYDSDDGIRAGSTVADKNGKWEIDVPAGKEILISVMGKNICCTAPASVCSEENVNIGTISGSTLPCVTVSSSELTYEKVSAESCKITGCSSDDEYVALPCEIDGLKVIAIGEECFAGNTNLRGIILPEGLLTVESKAFTGCTNLEKVCLPQTLENIGGKAFSGCVSLSEINIPLNIHSIKKQCFENCTTLENLYFVSDDITFGDNAFSGCTSLTVYGNSAAIESACTASSVNYSLHIHNFESETLFKVSCTEDGIYRDVCVCGKQKTYNVHATGHTESKEGIIIKEPTCTSCGQTDYICTGCGKLMRTQITDPLPHEYEVTVTAPTCTESGYTVHICKECQDEYRDSYTSPKGHTCEWVNDVTVEGEYAHWIYICTECSKTFNEKSESLVEAKINILNNSGRATVNYGDTLHLEAKLDCSVSGAVVQWFVDGEYYSTGKDFYYENITSDFSVSARAKSKDGNDIICRDLSVIDGELVKVNASFIMKIVSLFKNLFRINRIYSQ